MEKTHNLEVTGSSPVWSTLRIAVAVLFFYQVTYRQFKGFHFSLVYIKGSFVAHNGLLNGI